MRHATATIFAVFDVRNLNDLREPAFAYPHNGSLLPAAAAAIIINYNLRQPQTVSAIERIHSSLAPQSVKSDCKFIREMNADAAVCGTNELELGTAAFAMCFCDK